MAQAATMDAAGFTGNGTARDRVQLPVEIFDGTINMPVMHQAVKAYLANRRQGNAATKTRGFVAGGNQKPWKQKGTGRARQGSIRAPQWVGGGTVFGPQPRSYAQYVSRQVRALARKSAFNARAKDGDVVVVDRFSYEEPKTSRLVALLSRLGLAGRNVLVLTDGVKDNVYLSGRNLQSVRVMPYSDVSAYHVLWSDSVIIEAPAIGQELEPVPDREPEEAAPKSRAARAEKEPASKKAATKKKAAGRAEPAKKSTAKAADKKASGKKAAAKKASAKSSSGKTSTAGSPKKKAATKKKRK
ncbi:MAG: 50S ribosomal protein L4 [Gemmatimonadaceae bacterium]